MMRHFAELLAILLSGICLGIYAESWLIFGAALCGLYALWNPLT